MNWPAITGIAELIGAAGVIVSLVYVAVQVRHNTIATRRTNARLTASDHMAAVHAVVDEQIADIVLRGHENLESLSQVERYRFDCVTANWLQAIEQAFIDYRDGDFPEEELATYRNRIPGVLSSPGGSAWWSQRRVWFGQSFRDDVDALLATPPVEAAAAGVRPAP